MVAAGDAKVQQAALDKLAVLAAGRYRREVWAALLLVVLLVERQFQVLPRRTFLFTAGLEAH